MKHNSSKEQQKQPVVKNWRRTSNSERLDQELTHKLPVKQHKMIYMRKDYPACAYFQLIISISEQDLKTDGPVET